jgi:peptide/nickel transport system substrate-binding protein
LAILSVLFILSNTPWKERTMTHDAEHHPARAALSRRAFIRRSGLLGMGAASGLLWACAPAAPAAKPTEAPKTETKPAAASVAGTITIAQGADATSLDPQQTQGSAPRAMMAAMFDQLVTLDHEYKVVPWVATSWETPDERTWVFKLRDDVQFHSGEKLTSAAVKWSIERFVAPETKNIYASTLQQISSIELPDDYTVRLTTREPYPGLLDAMASYFYIAPPETMRSMGEEYFKKPVGSGPYKFVEWVAGDRLVQEAAAPHFSGDPKIKQVVWKTITEGPARVTALRTNAADIINPVSPQEVGQIQSGGAQVVQAKGQGLMCLVLNASQPPLNDVRVRQALNYAVDKDQIIRVLLGGIGEPSTGPLTYAHEGFDPNNAAPYPFNPDRARALLAEAGYPNGFDIQFDTPSGRYLQDKAIAEAVAGQWKRIGVNAQVNPREWGDFLKEAQAKTWSVFLITQGSGGTQVLLSTCFHSGVKGIPWLGYDNPQVNQMIDAAGKTMDTARRVQMYRDVVKTIRDEAPWVFLHNLTDVYGVGPRVQDWKPGGGLVLLRGTSVKA